MSKTIESKLVMISGAAAGVGYECASLFSSRGAKVLLLGRDNARLQAACSKLGKLSGAPLGYLAGDICRPAFAREAFEFAAQNFNSAVDILVNNAGAIVRSDATDTSDEEWRELMAVNVDAVFYLSRAAAQQMPEDGAIINVSSTCGQVGAAGLAAYCASKGAVNQLTRAMALELAPRKISVSAVAPGAIQSPMLYSRQPKGITSAQIEADNLAQIPVGELATPQEVARAVFFLATERHVTGTILAIDGGYTAR
jgi:NAD(P)-dependent dehydrogenase (short-subunit alcohol dehydrogenase family)